MKAAVVNKSENTVNWFVHEKYPVCSALLLTLSLI